MMRKYHVKMQRTLTFVGEVDVEAADEYAAADAADRIDPKKIEWGSAVEDDSEPIFDEIEEMI